MKLIGIKKASEITGIPQHALRKMMDEGGLETIKTERGHRRFKLVDIEKLSKRNSMYSVEVALEKVSIEKFLEKEQKFNTFSIYTWREEMIKKNCFAIKQSDWKFSTTNNSYFYISPNLPSPMGKIDFDEIAGMEFVPYENKFLIKLKELGSVIGCGDVIHWYELTFENIEAIFLFYFNGLPHWYYFIVKDNILEDK